MTGSAVLVLALAIGFVAGLRSMTPMAVVSGAAHFGWLDLRHTWASFLGSPVALCVFCVLALAELVGDKLPKTPSRKSPGPFAGRIIVGALTGAALGTAARQSPIAGALLGAIGGVVGTLGGRRRDRAHGRDRKRLSRVNRLYVRSPIPAQRGAYRANLPEADQLKTAAHPVRATPGLAALSERHSGRERHGQRATVVTRVLLPATRYRMACRKMFWSGGSVAVMRTPKSAVSSTPTRVPMVQKRAA
jgi:uncharacterized membrane protein